MPRDAVPPGSVVVFYDGVCGFCNGAVRFLARRDRGDRFRFAPLQGDFAREVLLGHDIEPNCLDTMYLLVDYGLPSERAFARAGAALGALRELGGVWAVLAAVAWLFPESLLNGAYRVVAGNRYRLFGRHEQCPLPSPQMRRKFVDIAAGTPDQRPKRLLE